MGSILNLTQHVSTPAQKEAGVFEPRDKSKVRELLTFDELPGKDAIRLSAVALAKIAKAHGAKKAMIGGAPFLMAKLEDALIKAGIRPIYAFSKRESVEKTLSDGSVEKTQVFRHLGFVEV